MSAMLSMIATGLVLHRPAAQTPYVPAAQLCVDGSNILCSKLPAYIADDPPLQSPKAGYSGLFGPLPTSKDKDVETPFDNMGGGHAYNPAQSRR
jgi:hypothetical protein